MIDEPSVRWSGLGVRSVGTYLVSAASTAEITPASYHAARLRDLEDSGTAISLSWMRHIKSGIIGTVLKRLRELGTTSAARYEPKLY